MQKCLLLSKQTNPRSEKVCQRPQKSRIKRQSKNQLYVSIRKFGVSRYLPTLFKILYFLLKEINNVRPIEFRKGDFVLFEWPMQGKKNFIVRIFKIAEGKIFGSFSRPASIKEFSGFVHAYPQIKDKAELQFGRIKAVLEQSKIYLRSMFLFKNIHYTK